MFGVHEPGVGLIMGLVLSDGYERQHYCRGYLHTAKLSFYNEDESLVRMFKETSHRLGLWVYQRVDQLVSGQKKWMLEVNSILLYHC